MIKYLLIGLGLIIPTILVILILVKTAKKVSGGVNLSGAIPGTSGITSFLRTKATVLVVLGTYLTLLYLTRELHPEFWGWLLEVEVFWPLQLTIGAFVLLFMFGPTWSKWILVPALSLVLFLYIGEKALETEQKREREKISFSLPAVPQEELMKFLKDPKPPEDLAQRSTDGSVWNLRVIYAGVIDRETWSPVITIPVPPQGNYYRIRPVSSPGQLEVMNRGRYLGVYPAEKARPIERRPLHLQYRSADHPKTALVVWGWTQGHP